MPVAHVRVASASTAQYGTAAADARVEKMGGDRVKPCGASVWRLSALSSGKCVLTMCLRVDKPCNPASGDVTPQAKEAQDLADPEDIINGKKYIIEQVIEQFTRGEEHDFGAIGNTDLHIVNLVFDTLKGFGYSFGEPSELRTLYVDQRKNELTRSEYWRKQNRVRSICSRLCLHNLF